MEGTECPKLLYRYVIAVSLLRITTFHKLSHSIYDYILLKVKYARIRASRFEPYLPKGQPCANALKK
jgi:hypothetical protein